MTPPRLRRIAWTLTICYAAFHFVMTHLPPRNVPGMAVSNYVLHFLSYGWLGGCLYLSLWLGGMSMSRAALVVIAGAIVFAAVDELLQAPVGRSPDVLDWVVDVAGAVLAVAGLSLVRSAMSRTWDAPKNASLDDQRN